MNNSEAPKIRVTSANYKIYRQTAYKCFIISPPLFYEVKCSLIVNYQHLYKNREGLKLYVKLN